MSSDIQAIETAVQHYFDGLYEGDVEKLGRVFHHKASLFIAAEGALVALPVPDWFAKVAARPSPQSLGAPRADRILMIDRTGPVNAMVKIACLFAPKAYVDYLSFIHFEGRWQIVAKSYCESP
ncbi:nuclear transport factor 2 family protein [Xylophilus sp. GOD-11R]|uniref:nuclear transport factor 2 family protein n=1 Tax=Xylophilus sp. GOD-11R TaxID=3089814 RepID=UPI00298BE4D2|nr:nuclear transport factor 2 family protein [Xylophilus sp. GOD-11R]WPB58905.1 nuclear transport factor 2 family protein [Xylophilus sp. GOD-11R]